MRHFFFIGFVSLLAPGLLAQPVQNIQIPPVAAKYAFNECEPSIAINPRNQAIFRDVIWGGIDDVFFDVR